MALFHALTMPSGLSPSSSLPEWQAVAEKDGAAAVILCTLRAHVREYVEATGGRLSPDEWARATPLERGLLAEARRLERAADREHFARLAGELALLLGADRERVAAYLEAAGAPELLHAIDDQAAGFVATMPGVG